MSRSSLKLSQTSESHPSPPQVVPLLPGEGEFITWCLSHPQKAKCGGKLELLPILNSDLVTLCNDVDLHLRDAQK